MESTSFGHTPRVRDLVEGVDVPQPNLLYRKLRSEGGYGSLRSRTTCHLHLTESTPEGTWRRRTGTVRGHRLVSTCSPACVVVTGHSVTSGTSHRKFLLPTLLPKDGDGSVVALCVSEGNRTCHSGTIGFGGNVETRLGGSESPCTVMFR